MEGQKTKMKLEKQSTNLRHKFYSILESLSIFPVDPAAEDPYLIRSDPNPGFLVQKPIKVGVRTEKWPLIKFETKLFCI